MNGQKFDAGKPMAGLLITDFSRALLEVAKVSTYGVVKYGSPSGWQAVPDGIQRYSNAMVRHMLSENKTPSDDESGLLHASHIAWNALALLELKLMELEKNSNNSL